MGLWFTGEDSGISVRQPRFNPPSNMNKQLGAGTSPGWIGLKSIPCCSGLIDLFGPVVIIHLSFKKHFKKALTNWNFRQESTIPKRLQIETMGQNPSNPDEIKSPKP